MLARFRVATTATGVRRQVWVFVFDDLDELRRSHAAAHGRDYDPDDDVAGSVVIQQGFRWPSPDPGPVIVMRLWTGQLTASTIAHEATHVATALYFMDSIAAWDTRARTVLMGAHEPLAYVVGDLTERINDRLHRLRLHS